MAYVAIHPSHSDMRSAGRMIRAAISHKTKRIARTKAERLALMKAIAAEMRADGRLPPLDLVDALVVR